jgi:hypothetical protein
VRGADGAQRLDRGRVVEEHAAAAVHLRVDETGQQHRAGEVVPLGGLHARVAGGHDRRDAVAFDEDRASLDKPLVGKDARVHECVRHQWVSVTLARCGGSSGSWPRAIATAFTSL